MARFQSVPIQFSVALNGVENEIWLFQGSGLLQLDYCRLMRELALVWFARSLRVFDLGLSRMQVSAASHEKQMFEPQAEDHAVVVESLLKSCMPPKSHCEARYSFPAKNMTEAIVEGTR